MVEECSSWDVVSDVDLWESGDALDQDGYVVVKQEDIVDGIACFMAAYLLSLKETKVYSQPLSLSHTRTHTQAYGRGWMFNPVDECFRPADTLSHRRPFVTFSSSRNLFLLLKKCLCLN